MTQFRTLSQDDALLYRNFVLEALHQNPASFWSSYEEFSKRPLKELQEEIDPQDDQYMIGAFTDEGSLIGMAAFTREKGVKIRHKAIIWGVYVTPAYRKMRIAQNLLRQILNNGAELEGLKQIHLGVGTFNTPAIELYRSLGFQTYGTERNALQIGMKTYDEFLMAYYYESREGPEG
jgi:ribosomal protein S18 acetylase RimI-like enzyme